MEKLTLAATARTPEIIFDPAAGKLLLDGESYPEDVSRFYQPVMEAVNAYLTEAGATLTVEIKLIYFNSSSARALTELCDLFDARAADGANIQIIWFCDDDDDITREFAEDLDIDLEHVQITIAKLSEHG